MIWWFLGGVAVGAISGTLLTLFMVTNSIWDAWNSR